MHWRTDKPTADVIVAYVEGGNIPEVLRLANQPYAHYYNADCYEIPYPAIIKWVDLEEDETVTDSNELEADNKERIEYLAKAVEILSELGYHKTANIINDIRLELKENNIGIDVTDFCQPIAKEIPDVVDECIYGKEETVIDCNELSDEIHKVWETCKPIDEGMGVETANIHIEQFDSIARHFAKWGAEHRDKFLNWVRDLIRAGIRKPDEALNILKRIDTLINDDFCGLNN